MQARRRPRRVLWWGSPGRLQLRFPALDTEDVCDVVLDEQPSRVVVRVVLCYRDDLVDAQPAQGFAEERTHRDLDRPLADRPVIDFETGEAVPFYVPTWRDGHRTTRPGYYTDRAASIAAAELLPRGVDPLDVVPGGALARSRALGW